MQGRQLNQQRSLGQGGSGAGKGWARMSITGANVIPFGKPAKDFKARVAAGKRAEDIGIIIGPTVVKLDWYLGSSIGPRQGQDPIVERKNQITTSAGDENWDSLAKHFREESEQAMAA
jgi:hypothetical protein